MFVISFSQLIIWTFRQRTDPQGNILVVILTLNWSFRVNLLNFVSFLIVGNIWELFTILVLFHFMHFGLSSLPSISLLLPIKWVYIMTWFCFKGRLIYTTNLIRLSWNSFNFWFWTVLLQNYFLFTLIWLQITSFSNFTSPIFEIYFHILQTPILYLVLEKHCLFYPHDSVCSMKYAAIASITFGYNNPSLLLVKVITIGYVKASTCVLPNHYSLRRTCNFFIFFIPGRRNEGHPRNRDSLCQRTFSNNALIRFCFFHLCDYNFSKLLNLFIEHFKSKRRTIFQEWIKVSVNRHWKTESFS